MVQEDYVSYEIAKLLKEKGFNEKCEHAYFNGGFFDKEEYGLVLGDNFTVGDLVFAPTHQMAMKWLREVHSIAIEPMLLSWGWFCQIEKIIRDFCKEYIDETDSYKTYEDAVEAALKYCLERLI